MGAIEPQFIASSAIPKRLPRQVMKSHVGDAASGLIPTTPEGVRVGHMALLPVFLAAVLVESGKGRLSGYVRQLLSEGTDKETWVLQHKKVGTLAVPLGFFSQAGSTRGLMLLQLCPGGWLPPEVGILSCRAI